MFAVQHISIINKLHHELGFSLMHHPWSVEAFTIRVARFDTDSNDRQRFGLGVGRKTDDRGVMRRQGEKFLDEEFERASESLATRDTDQIQTKRM
jgi:hypothetical protein